MAAGQQRHLAVGDGRRVLGGGDEREIDRERHDCTPMQSMKWGMRLRILRFDHQ